MTPSSRPAPRRSWPKGQAIRRRPSMSSASIPGARQKRAAGGLPAPPAPDAAKLTETLNGALEPDASVLYLAGRDRKGTIEAALESAFALEVVEAYAAEAREAWRPSEARALASCGAALHYSRRSAGLAAALAEASGVEARFLELEHVCLSRDVAEPLKAAGATRIAIAETPDEAGLFRALCTQPRRVSFAWGVPYIGPREIKGARRWSTRKPRTFRPGLQAPRPIATRGGTRASSKAKSPPARPDDREPPPSAAPAPEGAAEPRPQPAAEPQRTGARGRSRRERSPGSSSRRWPSPPAIRSWRRRRMSRRTQTGWPRSKRRLSGGTRRWTRKPSATAPPRRASTSGWARSRRARGRRASRTSTSASRRWRRRMRLRA